MRFYRILFLVIMGFMIIISLFTYFSYRQLSEEYLTLTQTEDIREDLEDIIFRLEESENFIRGFVITGDKHYLESMQYSSDLVRQRITRLDSMLSQNLEVLDQYDSLRLVTHLQLAQMDSVINRLKETNQLDQEDFLMLRLAEERLEKIRGFKQGISGILVPSTSNRFISSRTFTPLLIIIGFLGAIGAIIFMYSNLYRSLQSNLATEMELENNLIELGHEIQERVEAERLVERILDSSKSAVFLVQPVFREGEVTDFRFVKVNRQGEILTGISKEHLERSHVLEVFPGTYESGLFEDYKTSLREGREFSRELLYDFDGIHTHMEVRAMPVDDGLVVTATDITERIQAQRSIEESSRKFSTLFHQAFQFIALINTQGNIKDINESFLHFLGETSDRLIGRELATLAIWGDTISQEIKELFQQACLKGSARKDTMLTGEDGEETYLDLSLRLLPDESDAMLIFEARDVTELHWAKEANEFLAQLNVTITHAEDFNEAAKLVFNKIGQRHDIDTTEVWVPHGKKHVRLLSQYLFDPEQPTITDKEPYILPDDAGIINKILREKETVYIPSLKEVEKGMIYRREQLIEMGYRSLFAVPVVFEGQVLLAAMFLADTEIENLEELKNTLRIISGSLGALLIKKKAQDEQRRTNLILNEAEKISRMGSWVWHVDDGRVDWSEGMYRITGMGSDYTPSFSDFYRFVHPADRDYVREKLSDYPGDASAGELEFRIRLDGGAVRYVKVTSHPDTDYNGEIRTITGTMRDITRQKKYEINLQQKNQELEDSNRNLEQFAYIASHDLQEPLRKIRAFGGRLAEKYKDRLDEKGVDYFNRMQNAAERMQTLINDLLRYSRVARGSAAWKPTDLNHVVGGVLDDIETLILDRHASVHLGKLPEIQGDPVQLRQLFQNLLTNALKFVPEDRVPEVSVRTEDNPASVRSDSGRSMVTVIVEDNGIGVDDKYKDRIFGLFERLHGRNEYTGTGIGLAICRRVVQNHEGEIEVISKKDHGTIFKIHFPVNENNNL